MGGQRNGTPIMIIVGCTWGLGSRPPPWPGAFQGRKQSLVGWPLQRGSVPPPLPARVDSQPGPGNQSDHFAHFPSLPRGGGRRLPGWGDPAPNPTSPAAPWPTGKAPELQREALLCPQKGRGLRQPLMQPGGLNPPWKALLALPSSPGSCLHPEVVKERATFNLSSRRFLDGVSTSQCPSAWGEVAAMCHPGLPAPCTHFQVGPCVCMGEPSLQAPA